MYVQTSEYGLASQFSLTDRMASRSVISPVSFTLRGKFDLADHFSVKIDGSNAREQHLCTVDKFGIIFIAQDIEILAVKLSKIEDGFDISTSERSVPLEAMAMNIRRYIVENSEEIIVQVIVSKSQELLTIVSSRNSQEEYNLAIYHVGKLLANLSWQDSRLFVTTISTTSKVFTLATFEWNESDKVDELFAFKSVSANKTKIVRIDCIKKDQKYSIQMEDLLTLEGMCTSITSYSSKYLALISDFKDLIIVNTSIKALDSKSQPLGNVYRLQHCRVLGIDPFVIILGYYNPDDTYDTSLAVISGQKTLICSDDMQQVVCADSYVDEGDCILQLSYFTAYVPSRSADVIFLRFLYSNILFIDKRSLCVQAVDRSTECLDMIPTTKITFN